ncbi:hypothetical protein ACJIZ3_005338 [Penstemon smallii]|uniref:Uncharacterized protein n=1 Tax=Penstemon smallii TaxID=265156 RepID=A0ABD3S4Y6_9LAMI
MEESAVTQSSASGKSAARLLRYPLRSANKSKEEKLPLSDSLNSASATKRGRAASNVSKSVGVLDLSSKEKSGKPPRRFSISSKSNATPAPKSFGNITPISETRAKSTAGGTPVSDISRSSNRKKFCVLSSSSYWLSQIKLAESADKHSISLGFFKLAFEAGCEPIQRMGDELKAYVHRYNLPEHRELIKEPFESYKISENIEVSGTCSQVTAEGHRLSDDGARSSSSSVTDADNLKPKSLNIGANEDHQVKRENSETIQKNDSVKKTRRSLNKNATSAESGSEIRGRGTQKKFQKPIKQKPVHDKSKLKKPGKKSDAPAEGPLNSQPEKEGLQENKENMAAPQIEESTLAEV